MLVREILVAVPAVMLCELLERSHLNLFLKLEADKMTSIPYIQFFHKCNANSIC